MVVPAATNLVPWGSSWAATALVMKAFELQCLVSAWQQLRHYGRQAVRT